MALAYSGLLQLEFKNSKGQIKKWRLPISFFAVNGGTNREIHLNKGNDISIVSELEQARTYKNIGVGMPPLHGTADMQVTIDLIDANAKKSDLYVNFYVFKYKDGRGIEGLSLYTWSAEMSGQPEIYRGFLTFQIAFIGDIHLSRVMYNPGQKPKSFQM